MNLEKFFKRTRDILRPEALAAKTVFILGVGSGGARVAEEMARLGVGLIVLVDRPGERLEEHNLIRHPLGYSSLGRSKLEGMRDRLYDINPGCLVETVEMDVQAEASRLADLLTPADLVLLCTDNEPSKYAVNAAVVQLGVPMIFAGVFDGGCGGEVGRSTRNGACYACMASYLQRQTPTTPAALTAEPTLDYANPGNPTAKTTAALNIDIAQIALIQSRVALQTLLGDGELDGNYVLFGNRRVEGLFPRMLSSEIWTIPRSEQCLVCGVNDSALGDHGLAERLLQSAAAFE